MRKSLSIAGRISSVKEATSGFDYLRIALAVGVLFWHSYVVVHGHDAGAFYQASVFGAGLRLILPMFFSLSGFLVASSLERVTSLALFLSFRALRILPALTVEVALSAMIIGPIVTTVSLTQYFESPLFHTYLYNIVGFIHYRLPGVFAGNPWPLTVNASLWTVPYELECYVALIVVHSLGIIKRPLLIGAITLALSLAFFVFFRKGSVSDLAIDPVPGRMLVVCFLAGVSLYAARSLIPYSNSLLAGCVSLSAIFLTWPALQFLAPLPVAYVTIWLGLRNPPRNKILLSGDYSYGVYLYGFVVQQCLMYLFKDYIGSTFALFLTALAGTTLFAIFSWHVIEKPALRLKRLVSARTRHRTNSRPVTPTAVLIPDRQA